MKTDLNAQEIYNLVQELIHLVLQTDHQHLLKMFWKVIMK